MLLKRQSNIAKNNSKFTFQNLAQHDQLISPFATGNYLNFEWYNSAL